MAEKNSFLLQNTISRREFLLGTGLVISAGSDIVRHFGLLSESDIKGFIGDDPGWLFLGV